MKKSFLLTMCGIMLILGNGYAQTVPTPSFESLKLNSSPAFVLLGIEPDNIQRPTTPSKLVAGLQNAVVDGKLQPNVAFEISPYYLVNPQNTTSKRFEPMNYLFEKKDLITTMIRTLSVSLATSPTDKQIFGNLQPGTGIGWGIRMQIIDGKPGKKISDYTLNFQKYQFYANLSAELISYRGSVQDYPDVIDHVIDNFITQFLPGQHFYILSEKEWRDTLAHEKDLIKYHIKANKLDDLTKIGQYVNDMLAGAKKLKDTALNVVNHSTNPLTKEGFMLELAGGQALVFQNNTYDNATNAKTAIWLTPSWRFNTSKDGKQVSLVDAMFVGRYTMNNQQAGVDVANYIDYGLKGAVTLGNWSGSVEYVNRYASHIPTGASKNYTYRLTVGMDYKISETITFKFNFGSNFDGNTTTYSDPKKMFAVGGLNFGFMDFKNLAK